MILHDIHSIEPFFLRHNCDQLPHKQQGLSVMFMLKGNPGKRQIAGIAGAERQRRCGALRRVMEAYRRAE